MDQNKKIKLEIYKVALKFYKADAGKGGMCFVIKKAQYYLYNKLLADPYSKGILSFPEIYKQKPSENLRVHCHPYWFSTTSSQGINKRIQVFENAIKELSLEEESKERTYYFCEKCKGRTYDVDYCDNPSCPNMPCCGRPKELCKCKTS